MNRTDLRRFACVISAMVLVVVLSLAAACSRATPLATPRPLPITHLNTGWSYERDGVLSPVGELPATLEHQGDSIRFHRSTAGVKLYEEDYLLFRTRYASIRVWAGDALVYEAAQGAEHALGSMWHFVPAAPFLGGEQLTVELRRYEEETEWTLFEVLAGEPMNLRSHLLDDALPQLIFYVVTLFASVVLLILCAYMAIYRMPALIPTLSLALFFFLSGSWVLLDCKISTIWGGNFAVAYFLSYAAFFLMPIPFLTFLCSILKKKNCPLFYLVCVGLLNAVVCFLLHITGVVTVRHSAVTVQVLCVIAMLVSFWELWESAVKRKEANARFTFYGVASIYLCALVALGMHALGGHLALRKTIPFGVGFVILMVCMAADAMRATARFWRERTFNERYRMLAVQDSMTHLHNRNAFQIGIQQLTVVKPRRLAMVVFDLDCLKKINDHYGHHVGDQVICAVAQAISDVFKPIGHCFRIGGDEFCVIVTDERKIPAISRLAQQVIDQLQSTATEDLPLEVSYGWSIGDFTSAPITQEAIEAVFKRADHNMYLNKQERKACHGEDA